MLYNKTISKPVGLKTERYDLDADIFVFVREMSASDILYYQDNYDEKSPAFDYLCDMLSRSVVDEEGNPIFIDGADVAANFKVGMSALWELQRKIYALSKTPMIGADNPN